jgi:hypothetical protein
MGEERASTSGMRLTGKICCVCRVSLKPDPTHPTGERYCVGWCSLADLNEAALRRTLSRVAERVVVALG